MFIKNIVLENLENLDLSGIILNAECCGHLGKIIKNSVKIKQINL